LTTTGTLISARCPVIVSTMLAAPASRRPETVGDTDGAQGLLRPDAHRAPRRAVGLCRPHIIESDWPPCPHRTDTTTPAALLLPT
jgi:hypothetical protein